MRWLIPLTLVLATIAAYFPLPHQQFVTWDDHINVYRNPHYQPATLQSTKYFWTHAYNKTYRPLTHTVWALVAAQTQHLQPQSLPGDGTTLFNAAAFKSLNLLLHTINVLLVWALARRLKFSNLSSSIAALFFALHPLQVEAVAWVTGLNETLCALWSLSALLVLTRYLAFEDRKEESFRRCAWFCAATVCFVLALLSKPAAVALPLVAWLLLTLILRIQTHQTLRLLAPWLALSLIFAVLTRFAHPPEDVALFPSWPARFAVAGDAWTFYGAKILWPWPLCIDYGRTPGVILASVWGKLAWVFLAGLSLAAWKGRHRFPLAAFAFFFVLAWTLPVAGFSPFRFQLLYSTVADRYLYFALIGPALALAGGFDWLRTRSRFAILGAAPLLLTYALLSARQVRFWDNNFTLFGHTLEVNPRSFMAAANLGNAFRKENQLAQATQFYERALIIRPGQNEVISLLANTLTDQQRYAEAIPLWEAHLKQSPRDGDGWASLGVILLEMGRFPQANVVLERAVILSPRNSTNRFNWGIALWQTHHFAQAKSQWRASLFLDPNNQKARQALAQAK